MSVISPGDEVTVTITGIVGEQHGYQIVSTAETWHAVSFSDPDVKVTVQHPDRPTRREVLEQHSLNWNADCECGWPELGEPHDYPAHLDAVLTKWEEN